MNLIDLTTWIEEKITTYERELEIIKQSNKRYPIPDIVSRRVVETQIMDYRNILRKLKERKMICPLKVDYTQIIGENNECINYHYETCNHNCAWWDKAKQQCCIKTLSELKISGGGNTHPY